MDAAACIHVVCPLDRYLQYREKGLLKKVLYKYDALKSNGLFGSQLDVAENYSNSSYIE